MRLVPVSPPPGTSRRHWTVRTADGTELRARFLVAATGVLSVPHFPDVPGRADFAGESYHTGRWPTTAWTSPASASRSWYGSSGVQVIPVIADEVESLPCTSAANWCTPLNNVRSGRGAGAAGARLEAIKQTLNTTATGFLHQPYDRGAFDDSADDRRAFFEPMWESPGFTKLTSNYTDLPLDRGGQRRVVRVPRGQGARDRRGPGRRPSG